MLATLLLASLAAPQVDCTGWSLDDVLQPIGSSSARVGVNGDRIAVFSILDATAGIGGVSVHRVLPDGTGVVLEESFSQFGLGPAFASFTFGCAISNDGKLLLPRKRPLPYVVQMIEYDDASGTSAPRRIGMSGGASAMKSRHFDSDGETAAVATQGQGPGAPRIAVDVLGVDPVTGDWRVEDTFRGGNALVGYGIGNVTVRGDVVTLVEFAPVRGRAWERVAPGQWEEIPLPAVISQPSTGLHEFAIDGNVLATIQGTSTTTRVLDVYERDASGAWTLMASRPFTPPSTAGGIDLRVAGDRIAVQTWMSDVEIFRRTTPTTLELESSVDGDLMKLEDDFVIVRTSFGRAGIKVLPLDELASGFAPCETVGQNVCVIQIGGGLRYFLRGTTDRVQIHHAPANAYAVLFGQEDYMEPTTVTLDGLCLGSSFVRVMSTPIRTGADGTGDWNLDTANLMTASGTVSYVGRTLALQALVRSSVGTVSSDAVFVQL